MTALATELGARFAAQKRDFLGIGLSCLSDEEFLDVIRQAVRARSRLTVSFINPDYVLRAHKATGLLEMINRFDMVLPDGWGVVLGGCLLGLPVFALSAQHGFSNFLFGCAEGIPEEAAANLTKTFPGLPIAGTLHGYWDVVRGDPGRYDAADIGMMVDAINASGADILHVSIPTPMQQSWVWQVADRLNVSVIITGGSYLEHVAERMHWYPAWTSKLRLNWAYRLYRDPRGLWRRYSLDLVAFGAMLLRAKQATWSGPR